MSKQNSDRETPRHALFCCFGCMSSVGTLTAIAMLDAYKKLDQEKYGLFCTSAIAAGVPKHRKSTESARSIIVIDGCYNHCAQKILEAAGIEIDEYLNLLQDLKIPKIGPFKPFAYSEEDKERAIQAILKTCEHVFRKKSSGV